MMAHVSRPLGTSCPDHFLRTKIKPLFVDWDPAGGDVEKLKASIQEGLVEYRNDYESYYNRCKRADSPAMRDPNPTVVLIPGLGMMAWGKNKSESRVPLAIEFAHDAPMIFDQRFHSVGALE